MSWMVSIFVGILTGVPGLLAAGFIAAACVSWYHISSFEGKSGYFMAAIALLGGMAGVIIGMVTGRLLAGAAVVGFLKDLGLSWAIVLAIAGIAVSIAWLLADIPPQINRQYLDLEVEIKLPADKTNRSVNFADEASLTLGSVINHVQRKSEEGELRTSEARLEAGRWIIPGTVRLFSMRGLRSIDARIDGKSAGGFIVPLPARPGKQFELWSEWEPRPRRGDPPWPDTNPCYRFRVRRIAPPDPTPDPVVAEAQKETRRKEGEDQQFGALTTASPLADWMALLEYPNSEEHQRAARKAIVLRPNLGRELSERVASADADTSTKAMYLVGELGSPPAEVADAVRARARCVVSIAETIDPTAPDSRQVLYEKVHGIAHGVMAAAHGLRRAGVDIRPELRRMGETCGAREQSAPRDIQAGCEQIIRHFAELERSGNKKE